MLNEYKCWRCGKEVVRNVEPQARVYCESCRGVVTQERDSMQQQYMALKRKIMCETAISKMEKAGMYMHEYTDIAKDIMGEVLDQTDTYRSSDEVIAAMVLRSYGIEYEINKPVGDFNVDFFIPSMCVCLEIDGDRHEMKTIQDSRRDIVIRKILGQEWEVVRIKTNYFEKNPEELVNAIEEIYKRKKKLRKDNNGIIPEYFSRREKELYASLVNWRRVTKGDW